MDEIIESITHAIFAGTCVVVPLLFILTIFKITIPLLNNSVLVLAVNWTLLMGSTIIIARIIVEMSIQYYTGGEYEQYVVTNRIMGPNWVYFWFLGEGIRVLIPQILWIRKFRISIISSAIIVCTWGILFIAGILLMMHAEWSFSERLVLSFPKDVPIYLIVISIIYFILNKKMAIAKT